jgi:cell division protein FtsB
MAYKQPGAATNGPPEDKATQVLAAIAAAHELLTAALQELRSSVQALREEVAALHNDLGALKPPAPRARRR